MSSKAEIVRRVELIDQLTAILKDLRRGDGGPGRNRGGYLGSPLPQVWEKLTTKNLGA